MHKENTVYAYIIDDINKTLNHGTDYYEGKDKVIQNKLIEIYDFINNSDNAEVVIDDNLKNKEPVNKVDVSKLSKAFIDKMINIKIALYNIDNEKTNNHFEQDNTNKISKGTESFVFDNSKNVVHQDESDYVFKNDNDLLLNDVDDDFFDESKFDMNFEIADIEKKNQPTDN